MPKDAFLMYVDDWLSSGRIELMDAHEERGYFRLLLRAWKQPDCGLPTDDLTLAAWSRMGTQWFRETADRTLRIAGLTSGSKVRSCFVERNSRLFNERQLKEWDYQNTFIETRRRNGSLGGRPKKEPTDNQVVSSRLFPEEPNDNLEKPNLNLNLNHKTEELSIPLISVAEEIASAIHGRHPMPHKNTTVADVKKRLLKISKSVSGQAYKISKIRDVDAAHRAYCDSEQWQKNGGEFSNGLRLTLLLTAKVRRITAYKRFSSFILEIDLRLIEW